MRKIIATLLVAGVTAGALLACSGDDDDNNPNNNNPDGNTIVTMPDGNTMTMLPDGNMVSMNDGQVTTGDDGGDSGMVGTGCAFTDFVNDQITNHTNNNTPAVPNATVPQDPTCANSGSATQFSGLFH